MTMRRKTLAVAVAAATVASTGLTASAHAAPNLATPVTSSPAAATGLQISPGVTAAAHNTMQVTQPPQALASNDGLFGLDIIKMIFNLIKMIFEFFTGGGTKPADPKPVDPRPVDPKPQPTPTANPTIRPTSTPTANPTSTPTSTATTTPTATPNPTGTAKPTPTITNNPRPTGTVNPTPTVTAQPTPTTSPMPMPDPGKSPLPLTQTVKVKVTAKGFTPAVSTVQPGKETALILDIENVSGCVLEFEVFGKNLKEALPSQGKRGFYVGTLDEGEEVTFGCSNKEKTATIKAGKHPKPQTLHVKIGPDGVKPGKLLAKPGVPLALILETKNAPECVSEFAVFKLDRKFALLRNGVQGISLGSLEPGTYLFGCANKEKMGEIVVAHSRDKK